MDELSLHVVGAAYENGKGKGNRRFEIEVSAPGERVDLVCEPKNPADPNAVAVFSARGIQIGYLTAERAPWIGTMIENGRPIDAVFQEKTERGAAIRVAFDGKVPTLHPPRPVEVAQEDGPSDADIGFWPDELPPED